MKPLTNVACIGIMVNLLFCNLDELSLAHRNNLSASRDKTDTPYHALV